LVVVTSCRALPLTHVTDVDAISPQGAVRYGDCKRWFVHHDERYLALFKAALVLPQQLEVSTEAEKSGAATFLAIIFGPGHQHV
jgi:hypothetical protein|tara:strand:+ start:150 stop:401 length:252 start_codon:yes stop_codon:yes gene_type:complete